MLGEDLEGSGVRLSTSSSINKSTAKAKVFELSEKEHPYIPVSTTKILGKFTRDPPPDIPESALGPQRVHSQKQSETVEELRRWAKNRESNTVFKLILRTLFWQDVKIRRPDDEKLHRAVNHLFPSRMDMKVTICDFGEGRAHRQDVRLGDLEKGTSALVFMQLCSTLISSRISTETVVVYSQVDVCLTFLIRFQSLTFP
jgi:hypothetical protein